MMDTIKSIKQWGAKKYCYLDGKDDKIHVTVAGLSKKLGAQKMQELGSVDKFQLGMIFDPSGNVTAYYNDCKPHIIEVDNCCLLYTSDAADEL